MDKEVKLLKVVKLLKAMDKIVTAAFIDILLNWLAKWIVS